MAAHALTTWRLLCRIKSDTSKEFCVVREYGGTNKAIPIDWPIPVVTLRISIQLTRSIFILMTYSISPDWDPNCYKGQCQSGEYVAGVSAVVYYSHWCGTGASERALLLQLSEARAMCQRGVFISNSFGRLPDLTAA